jgi:hypothetical protein
MRGVRKIVGASVALALGVALAASVGVSRSVAQGQATGVFATGLVTVGATATDVFAATPSGGATRYRIRVLNTDFVTPSGGNGYVVWCRWGTAAGAAASVRGTGSFPVFPGGGFDDSTNGVSQQALNCIGETSGAKLYYETYTGGI